MDILCKSDTPNDVNDYEAGTVYVLVAGSSPSNRPSSQRVCIATFANQNVSSEKYTKFQIAIDADSIVYARPFGSDGWSAWKSNS